METYPSFFDLFAGIGGFRIAFEAVGADCVYSAEWDRYAIETYNANFATPVDYTEDIRNLDTSMIPDHDILVAGFPCQSFSIAGVSSLKSLDRPTGFEDRTRGTLFFEIARILRDKRPKAFLLENVKHLKRHDYGRTYRIMIETLINELGYYVWDIIYDAALVVPQHRERVFMVGFQKPYPYFLFPEIQDQRPRLADILMEDVHPKYTLKDGTWNHAQEYARRHRDLGHGFGYFLADPNGIARTLMARYYKDGREILIPQDGKNPRRLTPRECCRLMGFPDDFKIPVSDVQAYRQFGNAVVPKIVESIADAILKHLKRQ